MFGLRKKNKSPEVLRYNLYHGTGDFNIFILAKDVNEANQFCKKHFPYHYLKLNLHVENVCISGNIIITNN